MIYQNIVIGFRNQNINITANRSAWIYGGTFNLTDSSKMANGVTNELYAGYFSAVNGYFGVSFASAMSAYKIRFYSKASNGRVQYFRVERYNGGLWTKVPIILCADNASLYNTNEAQMTNADGWGTVIFRSIKDTQFRVYATGLYSNSGDDDSGITEFEIYK